MNCIAYVREKETYVQEEDKLVVHFILALIVTYVTTIPPKTLVPAEVNHHGKCPSDSGNPTSVLKSGIHRL